MQDALLAMFVLNRGRLVGHLYLGSTLGPGWNSPAHTTSLNGDCQQSKPVPTGFRYA